MTVHIDALAAEFVTLDAVLTSEGITSRVDALILAWVKMEKQLRKLFCFLVYQHPTFGDNNIDQVIKVIAENKNLYYHSFIKCIDNLGPLCVRDVVGPEYDRYLNEIKRIHEHRNKLLHGQITGKGLTRRQLEKDISLLRQWISLLAASGQRAFGYDGVGRNTFRKAKAMLPAPNRQYPFSTVQEFRQWLSKAAK